MGDQARFLFRCKHPPIGDAPGVHRVRASALAEMTLGDALSFDKCVWTNIRPGNAQEHAHPSVPNPANVSWIVTADRVVVIYPEEPEKPLGWERYFIDYRHTWFRLWVSPDWSRHFIVQVSARRDGETPQQSVARALEVGYLPKMRSVPLTYKPLPVAPVGQADLAHESQIAPGNPFGMQGENRRVDLPGGGARWWNAMGRHSVAHGCQGHIFWRFRAHRQGCMYRPDVFRDLLDVWPGMNEVIGFAKEAGQWVGCTIRPGKVASRHPTMPDVDVLRRSENVDDFEYHVATVTALRERGIRHFYVDEPVDLRLLRMLRQAMGPDCNFFLESATTEHLHLGGLYHEVGIQHPHNPEWFVWLARLIYPSIPVIIRIRDKRAVPDGFCEIVEDWQWSGREPKSGGAKVVNGGEKK